MKYIYLVLFSFLLLVNPVSAKTLSKVAAVVNDEIITTFQLDNEVKVALRINEKRNQMTAAQFDKFKLQVLQKMINDKLLEQRSKELGLTVPDADLESAIKDVEAKNGLTREALIRALAAQGTTFEAYRESVRKEILRYKLLSREVSYKVLVTTNEIRNYYNKHMDECDSEPKIRINRISYTLPTGDEEQKAAFYKQVDVTRDLLLNGEDFATVLAGQGQIATGGDMGEVPEADLAKPIQQALEGLKAGDVSEPVEINGQLHLFQITARTAAGDDPFELARDEIEAKLRKVKADARLKEWQKELNDNAHIEIRI